MVQQRLKSLFVVGATIILAFSNPNAFSDGSEILDLPSIEIAPGSGIAMGGVGLFLDNLDGTFTNLDGDINVSVPADATVKQVLLYWVGESGPSHAEPIGDDSCIVNGTPVVGTLIGGSTRFYGLGDGSGGIWYEVYRQDITDLAVVTPGDNTLTISGLDFSYRNTGAGVIVIYDDGTEAIIELYDGLDLAFHGFAGDLETVVPISISFEPSNEDRIGYVPLFVASAGADRPNVTEITIAGTVTSYFNLFSSNDGPRWDSVMVPISIPAGAEWVTIELLSADGGDSGISPASFAWIVGGLVIEEPLDDCGDCLGGVTDLTLKYLGPPGNPRLMSVVQFVDGGDYEIIWYDFLVEGGDEFTVSGINPNGTFGEDIFIFIEEDLHAKFRTDCEESIGIGKSNGGFVIIDGQSKDGGSLCEYSPSQDEMEFDWFKWWIFWQEYEDQM